MKTLLKTPQTHRKAMVASSVSYSKNPIPQKKQNPPTNLEEFSIDSYQPTMEKAGNHWPSVSRWDFLGVRKTKNPRDKCLSPTWPIQVGTWLSWLPEGLWNSLAHLRAMVGMAAITWQRQCWPYDFANS